MKRTWTCALYTIARDLQPLVTRVPRINYTYRTDNFAKQIRYDVIITVAYLIHPGICSRDYKKISDGRTMEMYTHQIATPAVWVTKESPLPQSGNHERFMVVWGTLTFTAFAFTCSYEYSPVWNSIVWQAQRRWPFWVGHFRTNWFHNDELQKCAVF